MRPIATIITVQAELQVFSLLCSLGAFLISIAVDIYNFFKVMWHQLNNSFLCNHLGQNLLIAQMPKVVRMPYTRSSRLNAQIRLAWINANGNPCWWQVCVVNDIKQT